MDTNRRLPASTASRGIEDLDLSTRAYNALKRHGVNTLGQLAELGDEEMLGILWFGRKCLADVHRVIRELSTHPPQEPDSHGSSAGSSSKPLLPPGEDEHEVPGKGWAVPKPVTADLDVSVDALALSTRSFNVLRNLEIRSIRQLLHYPKQGIFKAENCGRKTITELESKLRAYCSGNFTDELIDLPLGQATPFHGTKAFVNAMLSKLTERQMRVIADRYGLWDGIAETLQDIGDKFGITRERVRQIEAKALARLGAPFRRSMVREFVREKVGSALRQRNRLGVITADEALATFADDCTFDEAAVAAILFQEVAASKSNLFSQHLVRVEEDVYCADVSSAADYSRVLDAIRKVLEEGNRPAAEGRLCEEVSAALHRGGAPVPELIVQRIVSVSPSVTHLRNGTVVLSRWSAFRRRDAASLAEAALAVLGRPAHFREIKQKVVLLYPEVRDLVDERSLHNRLVQKSDKFVWVASGTYGLKAWGLKRPPYIKDRLVELLSEARYPLPYWHLKEKVLEVCNCKEASVRMTLDLNPKVFKKFGSDQYGLRVHY